MCNSLCSCTCYMTIVIVSMHPSALIIVGHQAPPLLAATAGPRGPGRLVWIELLSWALDIALRGWSGEVPTRAAPPRHPGAPGGSRAGARRGARFLCPPAGCWPAPLLEGVATLLSDLPKSHRAVRPLGSWSRIARATEAAAGGGVRGGFSSCQSHHRDGYGYEDRQGRGRC